MNLLRLPVSTCGVCGKQGYRSRREARRAARVLHPGRRVRAYSCAGRWHFTSQAAATVAEWKDRNRRGAAA